MQGLPALASLESESSPSRPLRWGAGGSKEAGVCLKTLRLETQLLSLNLSSIFPRPAASGLEDARQPARSQAVSSLAGPEGAKPERSARQPRASPRLGAEGEPGSRKGSQGRSSTRLAAGLWGPQSERRRRRARGQRRGAETRAPVGAGSGAGRAGRGRRRGRPPGAGAGGARKGVASSWSGVGGSGGRGRGGGERVGRRRAWVGNGWRVGAWSGAHRSRARKRLPLQPGPRRGRKPAGGGGRRQQRVRVCAREGEAVRARAATAALFLSPAAASPSAEPSRGKRAGRRLPCRRHLPPAVQPRALLAASVLRAPGHLAAPV